MERRRRAGAIVLGIGIAVAIVTGWRGGVLGMLAREAIMRRGHSDRQRERDTDQ